ncbi:mechanosensitive ion channel protein MscS [Candidatus Pacearchaeota archaeon CG10_big_fil_rev_8_21_14_0_10_34_76]|nr:MAG: mechanosensitive ion channel protein MscS [Candidatus Pacearchaeota archaeon CG10_big_fil_rev_8_21_14_0_10_34_76]
MPFLENLESFVLWSNTGKTYFIAILILIGSFIILKIFDRYIIVIFKKAARKTKFTWDDVVFDFFSAINWQFYAYISFYIATRFIILPELLDKFLYYLLIIFIAFYAAQGLSRIVDHFTNKQVEKRKAADNVANTSMLKTFGIIFKIAIYAVGLLMVLANLGIEITPLVASLGVGGIAIAIALQSVLSDLFAAFAIYFDKPFKEGDFIIVGDDLGTVKNIGIKTTRIQTLQGQELIMSNTELTNSRVNNYQRMKERRIAFTFGVTYDTPLAKMKKINQIVEKAVNSTKNARFDRSHFHKYGDFSLNYEVVYYVTSPDYAEYMDVQQEINFKIKEAFEKEKIEFAFPTQTIHVEGIGKKK